MKEKAYQILKRPLLTEKSTAQKDSLNKLFFQVDRRANKIEILAAFLDHDIPCLAFALEESVRRTALGFLSIAMNKPLHLGYGEATEDQVRAAFDKTVGSGRVFLYDHFGSMESDNLFLKIRQMVRGCGVQGIILDHISIVISGLEVANERKEIDIQYDCQEPLDAIAKVLYRAHVLGFHVGERTARYSRLHEQYLPAMEDHLVMRGKGDRMVHDLSFSPDGRHVFVTNSEDGSLTVFDTSSLEVIKKVDAGDQPASVDVSAMSGDIYVTDRESGSILILNRDQFEEVGRLNAEPGMDAVGISPDGKWGFAINPDIQQVFVFDAVRNRITHVVPVKGVPDQIYFTDAAAYIHSASSPAIFVIPFEEINPTGNISVLTVPVGDLPPEFSETSTLANEICTTPEPDPWRRPSSSSSTRMGASF